MNITNLLPKHFIEHEFFNEMFTHFDKNAFSDKKIFVTRSRNEVPEYGKDVVVIRTADDERGRPPRYIDKVGYVFQHHLEPKYQSVPNLFHIPLPYAGGFTGNSSIPILERKYDVVFIGRVKKNRRDMFSAAMKYQKDYPEKKCKFVDIGTIFYFNNKKRFDQCEYSEIMSNAKISLSPKGNIRCECIRFSEAVKCGSAIIACMHPLEMRLWKNTPASYIKNWSALESEINKYTDERLVSIHKRMKKCWEDYFSPKAVAEYICRKTKRV